jgi:ubiquinone/menaquinone biosynthesis C-methylase UbiE
MSLLQDPEYLLTKQYRTPVNLNSRINLHLKYSTNKYGWFKWVFDRFQFSTGNRILELGCGPGDLWVENYKRIPEDCFIALSDFSMGMVTQTKETLLKIPCNFNYYVIDAPTIPFKDDLFDAVIANHCVYHFSDRLKAFSEIKRVLKPGGTFYSTTVGINHLLEIAELVTKFKIKIDDAFEREENPFTLESGGTQLRPWFGEVKIYRYADSLLVTEPEPLVDFVLSTAKFGLNEDQRKEFTKFIKINIERKGGAFSIHKDSGIFIST